jgi:hypothetical protein
MNLNAGKETRDLRNVPGQKAQAVAPEPVTEMMHPDGVQSGIQDHNLENGASGGVGFEDGGDVFAD